MREIQREGAAFAGHTAKFDFSSQQVGQLTADGQPQTGAAVLATRASVGLLECFENNALLFRRNANACVGHFEGHYQRRPFEHRMIVRPAAGGDGNSKGDMALGCELKRVRQQILQHLQ